MKEGRTLPVIQPAADAGLSRRAALQSLAAGIGASMAVPGLAEADDHPVHKHVAQVAEQAKKPGAAARPASPYKPATFDAHQFATVVLLSELIVPGAQGVRHAGVPRQAADRGVAGHAAPFHHGPRRRWTARRSRSKQKPFKDLARPTRSRC